MHIIRLIGGIAAISMVAGTLVFSLKSVPKAVNKMHLKQQNTASASTPTGPAVASKDETAAPAPASPAPHPDEARQAGASNTVSVSSAPADFPPSTPVINKCNENGKVTYTSNPCPGSATQSNPQLGTSSP